MNRRDFLSTSAAAAAASATLPRLQAAEAAKAPATPFVGVQLGAHTVFDEGAERVLDNLASAEVNALFIYSHMYQAFANQRDIEDLAPDHGVAPIDPKTRRFSPVWAKPNERFYANTKFRHFKPGPEWDLHDKDVFEAIIGPAHQRGIKVYARALAPDVSDMAPLMPEFADAASINHLGQPNHQLCFNHPDYRNWWLATVEDTMTSYPLDGFKWGYERCGPLSTILATPEWLEKGEDKAYCFCEHCVARGKEQGFDVDRVRQGFTEFHALVQKAKTSKLDDSSRDGLLVTLLRILMKYPELLAWERFYYANRERFAKELYQTVHRVRDEAEFGRHIWHQMSFDPIYRAAFEYEPLADYHDFLKPVVYHTTAATRMWSWAAKDMAKGAFQELGEDRLIQVLYDILNYDNDKEPARLQITTGTGFSADYVYRETKRCADAVKGRCKVHAGIGIDMAGNPQSSVPEVIVEATLKAFEAGADGILISREYDEMRLRSLNAVGDGIRAYRKTLPS